MVYSRFSGQSAIEYLMTYGWMLLVVAIVGGAIFSVAQSESVDTVSGMEGEDAYINEFGVTSEDELGMDIQNRDSNSIVVSEVNVTDPETGEWVYKEFTSDSSIGVGSDKIFQIPNVTRTDGANTLDITITYDSGALENMRVEGTISGNLELTESNVEYEGPPQDEEESAEPEIVEDFEWGGSVEERYDGDTDQFEIVESEEDAAVGSHYLELQTPDEEEYSITSDHPEAPQISPEQGQVFEIWFKPVDLSSAPGEPILKWDYIDEQNSWLLRGNGEEQLGLFFTEDGSMGGTLDAVELNSGEWNRLEFDWAASDSDEVVLTSFDEEDNEIDSLSWSETGTVEGDDIWFGLNNDDGGGEIHFDRWRIIEEN